MTSTSASASLRLSDSSSRTQRTCSSGVISRYATLPVCSEMVGGRAAENSGSWVVLDEGVSKPKRWVFLTYVIRSLRPFESCGLDDGVEFIHFGLDVAREVLGGLAAHRLGALAQDRILDVGHGQGLCHAGVQLVDNWLWRPGWRQQTGPADHDRFRVAGFGRRRCVGKLLVAF